MIVRSKAPLCLGLAGGGSDVSPHSDIYSELVLNATISLYTYCIIEETSDVMITINSDDVQVYSSYLLTEELEVDGKASLIKGDRVIRDFNITPRSFKIMTYNDVSVGSGLGTSSAMAVCILKVFIRRMAETVEQVVIGRYENYFGKLQIFYFRRAGKILL